MKPVPVWPDRLGDNQFEQWFEPNSWSNTFGDGGTQKFAGLQSNGDPVAASVTSITAWQDHLPFLHIPYLVRLDFTYSDGTSDYAGVSSTSGLTLASKINLEIGERIASGVAWTLNGGSYLNSGYRFQTTLNKTLTLGCLEPGPHVTKKNLGDTDGLDVGSGILLGAVSTAGKPTYMCLCFLKGISSTSLSDVSYPQPPNSNQIKLQVEEVLQYSNTTSTDAAWHISKSTTKATTMNWSIALTAGMELTTKVSAGIYGIAEAGVESKWSLSATTSYTSGESKSETLTWTADQQVPGHTLATATLSYGRGTISIPYTGTLNVILSNGSTYEAPVKGTFTERTAGYNLISVSSTPLSAVEHNADE